MSSDSSYEGMLQNCRAENSQLRAEVERLNAECGTLCSARQTTLAELTRLRQENEELTKQRDAAQDCFEVTQKDLERIVQALNARLAAKDTALEELAIVLAEMSENDNDQAERLCIKAREARKA